MGQSFGITANTYQNNNLLEEKDIEIRKIRGKDIAIIFQEPMSALNPTMRCVDQLRECIKEVHIDKKARDIEIGLLIDKGSIRKGRKF